MDSDAIEDKSYKPKTMDSDAIETSHTNQVSGKLGISLTNVIRHLHELLELANCTLCYQNIAKFLTHSNILCKSFVYH